MGYFVNAMLEWKCLVILLSLNTLAFCSSDSSSQLLSTCLPKKGSPVKLLGVSRVRPCCCFPCLNGGICIDKGNRYYCDCVNTGYTGRNCAIEKPMHACKKVLFFVLEFFFSFVHVLCMTLKVCPLIYCPYYEWMINESLDQIGSGALYSMNGEIYPTLDPSYSSVVTRLTPPVTKDCPTPLGVRGKKVLPLAVEVYDKLLKRQRFIPNKNVNLLFTIFGQHFALQFLEQGDVNGVICRLYKVPISPSSCVSSVSTYRLGLINNAWITCKQIYCEYQRSYRHGKLRVEKYKGEEFPVFLKRTDLRSWICSAKWKRSDLDRWKEFILKQNSLTYAIATLWVREHNRVCDVLKKQWFEWDDERLFQTARNIITGEMLVITTSEWLPVLAGFRTNLFYEPSYANLGRATVVNRMSIETFLAFHWPHLIPDNIEIKSTSFNITSNVLYNLNDHFVKHFGLYEFLRALSLTPSGQVTPGNSADSMSKITQLMIEEGRQLRFPSLNKIRTSLGLHIYTDFSQFARNDKQENNLKKLYGDIEGLEFVPGMLMEPASYHALGETATTLIKHWLLRALVTHPLGSKSLWRPGSVGGAIGWSIILNAKFSQLACTSLNRSELCLKEGLMTFRSTALWKRSTVRKKKLKKTQMVRVKKERPSGGPIPLKKTAVATTAQLQPQMNNGSTPCSLNLPGEWNQP